MEPRILVDRYRLEHPIGEGGMSVVWQAEDQRLGRSVAVKVLRHTADEGSRAGLRSEARAVAGLRHPNLTSVYDYGEFTNDSGEPTPFVVMELLRGTSLADAVAAGPLPRSDALTVCAEVAAALAAAHARGIVHRDIKPSNVMLTAGGAKVLDFGIAAAVGQNEVYDERGRIMGTPAYVAPERLSGACVLPATDVYALGLLMYRLLTGGHARPARDVRARPAELPLAYAPAEVAEIYRACVAQEPCERPPAAEVAAALQSTAELKSTVFLPAPTPTSAVSPTRAVQPTVPWRNGARRAAVLIGTAVLGAAVLTMAVLSGPSEAVTVPTGPRAAESFGLPAVVQPGAAAEDVKPAGKTFQSAGGAVAASCANGRVRLGSWVAARGFSVRKVNPGPSREARVEFEAGKVRVNVTVHCADDLPVARIKA